VAGDVAVERSGAGVLDVKVTADDAVRDSLDRGGLGELGQSVFGTSADRDISRGPDGADPFADLRRAGWDVQGVPGGVRFRHGWTDPAELDSIVASLGGGDPALSPIQRLEVVKKGGFPKDNLELEATVGLDTGTILTLATRGAPNAPTQGELEDVLGEPLESLVAVRFSVQMPGSVVELRADPAPPSNDDLTWNLAPRQRLELYVHTDFWNAFVRWVTIIAVVLVVAFGAFVIWRRIVVLRRRRGRSRPTAHRDRLPSSPVRRP